MSAFDAKTRTMRTATDPGTDPTLPPPKSLSWMSIASRTALFGTEGEHCELINGDLRQKIDSNQKTHILQDQAIGIDGKHKETIAEDCHQNFIGPQTVTNHTVRNETALGRYTKVWGLATCEEDHSDYMKTFPSHWEQYDYSEDRHDMDNLYTTDASSTTVLQFQVDAVQMGAGVAQGVINVGEAEVEFSHAELRLFHFELHYPTETKNWLASPQAVLAEKMKLD